MGNLNSLGSSAVVAAIFAAAIGGCDGSVDNGDVMDMSDGVSVTDTLDPSFAIPEQTAQLTAQEVEAVLSRALARNSQVVENIQKCRDWLGGDSDCHWMLGNVRNISHITKENADKNPWNVLDSSVSVCADRAQDFSGEEYVKAVEAGDDDPSVIAEEAWAAVNNACTDVFARAYENYIASGYLDRFRERGF